MSNHDDDYEAKRVVGRHGHDKCGTSDANTEFGDGHWFCFVCNEVTKFSDTNRKGGSTLEDTDADDNTSALRIPKNLKFGPILDRSLTADTVRKYNVRLKIKDGVIVEHFYPYTNKDKQVVAWKVRNVKDKTFPTIGSIQRAQLFGQNLFTAGSKYVTLCEGEIDAMAVYQMQGSKYTSVSIKNGAKSAYRDCRKQFDWLDTFENIIICFDADEEGSAAARQVASLFPKKAKIVQLDPKLKDAGKYLEEGKWSEFTKHWWAAEKYVPEDIITGEKAWDIVNTAPVEARWQYPWDGLNYMTYGMRTGEVVLFTAGSGMGKTTVLREIAYHVFNTSEDKIGMIFLEEQGRETIRGMMSVEASIPFHLPDAEYTPEQLRTAYERTWGTHRMLTLDSSKMGADIDYISDRIKYLAIAEDCKFIILDHISFLVSDKEGDERKMLDSITHRLKALAVELDILVCAVVHTKRQQGKSLEEGGQVKLSDLRGSGGLGQLSNMVFGLERNSQSTNKELRNTTVLRVIKNRFCGRQGPACALYYDEMLGRLIEKDLEDEEKTDGDTED